MKQRCSCRYTCVLLLVLMPAMAFGQTTTYHLHKETSKTGGGVLQLKTVGPDAGDAGFNVDLKNRPVGEYPIKAFDTAAGSPNLSGVIPSGSVVSFTLWMRKTNTAGSMYPRARVKLNSSTGATLCEATSTTPLTTTLAIVAMTCSTTANIVVSATDRIYLWTGVNLSATPGNAVVRAELRIEGSLNGNYDSRIAVPMPMQPPTIASLSPTSGSIGTTVAVAGTNFGGTQAGSTLTFNGAVATPTAWSATNISTPVPSGAATGPVVVTVAGLPSNGVPFTVTEPEPPGPVNYAYDVLGRLIQVTSASGLTAIYRYDAVGNILAIERLGGGGGGGGSSVGISGFMPSQGSVGASVTITGVGFSSVPSENIVTFNGTAASVTAASTSELTAIVPAGAVTGQIGVTSPTGSATSASAFTVLPDSGAPTITGFTPTIGVAGTPITITGTNLETRANDRVTLNIKSAEVTGATPPATLTTAVPAASLGGRFAVTTPVGTGVSADDFFVAPSPYTAADVEFAQRLTLAQSQAVSISTAGRIALLLFDGAAGQKMSVVSVSSTWTSCFAPYSLTVYAPDASLVKVIGSACGTTTLMDQQTLPMTGTYTLMLDPSGANTGSASVTVYTFADVTGPITADGTSVAVSLTTPAQNALLTFAGTAGQVVSGLVSNATIPSNCASYSFYLKLLRPDGSTQGFIPSCSNGVFLDRQTLSTTGTYTLMLDAIGTSTGDATMTLYTVVDASVPASDGTGIPVAITTPGQNAHFTFSGTQGQVVSGLVSNATIPGNCSSYAFYLKLIRPDGSTQAFIPSCSSEVFLDRQTLSTTGTYTLMLDPIDVATGDATVTLYTVVDVTGPIADATSVPVVITTPGQNGRFTFTGSPGQVVTGLVSNATIPGNCLAYAYYLMLMRPDGSRQAFIPSCGSSVFLDRQTLAVGGTYTLLLDPIGASTGTANVTLYTVVDVTGSIEPNGASVPLSFTTPGQNAQLTFSGTAGQVVNVFTANNTIPGNCFSYAFYLRIVKPDGSWLANVPACGGDTWTGQRTLPVTGTYTVQVDPTDSRTGSITITLTSP